MKRIPIERFWLDHLLATICGVMGVYAVAMSVAGTTLPMTLAAGVLLAGIAGFGLSLVVEDTVAHKADGWLFAGAAIFGILRVRDINAMLPDDGFPFALIAATMMFVILVAGGLFAWRDSTLLFTTLPSLVLFGLVGTIDTWRPGLFLFCALILCIALLYARVHQRTMVQWAEEGGADRRYLYRDVWKWVAGPEYAFVAAGSIILFSFLGAPVIQGSLSGVSDAVRINVGSQIRQNFRPPTPSSGPAADAPIGSGPVNLSDRLIATVEIPRPMYLRRFSYDQYSRRGWSSSILSSQNSSYLFSPGASILQYKRGTALGSYGEELNGEPLPYSYASAQSNERLIPTPGQVLEIEQINFDPIETSTGSIFLRAGSGSAAVKTIVSVPKEEEIKSSAKFPDSSTSQNAQSMYTRVPNELLTTQPIIVDRYGKSDYEQLYELKTLIGQRCKYNTQTAAVPKDRDPVDYFLNDSKVGYCDLFASAFVIEARRLGFPTRYVTGYLMEPSQRQPDGTYHILEKHSHSWAEVYFQGYGWIPFDATEGAENITPTDAKIESNSFLTQAKEWLNDNIALVASVVIGLLLGGIYLLLKSRSSNLTQNTSGNRPLRIAHNRLQMAMERVVGNPKRFSQTLREYAEAHSGQLSPVQSDVDSLLPVIERAMYSATGSEGVDFQTIATQLSDLEKRAKVIQKERKRAARFAKRTA
ncbi:MAG: transglutaminase-like domain-containing protein [Fimbriimonadaceae bacterium]